MKDILRRELAPIADAAWAEIDAAAARSLKSFLSARAVVDVTGPLGWDTASLNTGRLNIVKQEKGASVNWGVREVLPLIELRAAFNLDRFELDNVSRGAKDPDLAALEATAREAAIFEEGAVYLGCSRASVKGIFETSTNKPLTLPSKAGDYPSSVGNAVTQLRSVGVGGPYALVLGTKPYGTANSALAPSGVPLLNVISKVIEGPVLWSPVLEGGVLLSRRGGDFELTLGQDFSIGYAWHDKNLVELFLTESFTFRVLQPEAAVPFRPASGK